jgi:hypothetical protein
MAEVLPQPRHCRHRRHCCRSSPTATCWLPSGAGFSVATIETYKTFFFPNRPRGKFAGKPIRFPEHLVTRQRFIPLYAGIWAVVLIAFVLGYLGL